jgi:putative membrane protein
MKPARIAAATLAALFLAGAAGGSAAAAESLATVDETFVTSAHQGNLAEIAAGRDAGEHATTGCVKEAGATLVRDHTRLDASLTDLAERFGVELPNTPTPEQQRQLEELRTKAGTPAYDAGWLTAQAAAHQETLALIDRELADGENDEVKAAARAARPVVAMHLDMVRGGECHAAADPARVPAGLGAPDAPGHGPAGTAGLVALAGGTLLATAGAARLVHGRAAE